MNAGNIVAKGKDIFENWSAPLVNMESTLLLFATFIFHRHYFGAEHATANFLALDGALPVGIYSYGAIVLLVSLIKIPKAWHSFVAFMVFMGSALISIAYTSLFWIGPSTPTWQELLPQLYYLLQGVLSLVQVILLLTQEEGKRLAVTPRLGGVPAPLKSLAILAYVVGMTLLLHRGFSVAPDAVTDRVNLYGAILLQVFVHLSRWRASIVGDI
jgi:hypothetical protein